MAAARPPAWVPWQRELRDSPLDPTAKLVGWALSTYMGPNGCAQVSRSTIARACGLSVSAVLRAIQRLESAGLLLVDRVKGGHYGANLYRCRNGGARATVAPDPTVAPAPPLAPANGGANTGSTVAPAPPEREGLKTSAGASAAPPGWVPEDDSAIAEIYRQRELDAAERAKGSTEGYGDPAQAEAARHAALEARKVLGAQLGTDPRP